MNNNWYVLYTKSDCEKKVSALLTKKKINNYCPLNKLNKQLADRKKTIFVPLFNSFVFVNASEIEIIKIKKTNQDIVNFVYWLGKPVEIREEEIENIKLFLEEYSDVKIEKTEINMNNMLRFVKGPYMDSKIKSSTSDEKYVCMNIQSLGYILKAEYILPRIEMIKLDFENTKNLNGQKSHSFSLN
jgi:transcription antitermination factor NusG